MHRGMRHETEAIGVVFFLIFYMFSVYGICNLFICVILAAFEMEEEEKENLQVSTYRRNTLKKIIVKVRAQRAEEERQRRKRRHEKEGRLRPSDLRQADEDPDDDELNQAEEHLEDGDFVESMQLEEDSDAATEEEEVQEVEVLFCLPPPMPNKEYPNRDRNLRYVIRKLARATWYNRLLLATILFSTGMLAAQSKIRAKSLVTDEVVLYSDYVCYGIFVTEFVVKILDVGATGTPQSYFRQPWNLIDFVLLCAQTLDFIGVDGMKALRVLRQVFL
jgi:hypothetical protein